ncbi:GAF domain-containing protein [Dactylosporangium sp. CA-233914]|uniref:GAF domain-containing protein n=1 Tax=Dactylosporangium sp. CA-233914 TaxID=3239934 RepID=UPI003D89CF78
MKVPDDLTQRDSARLREQFLTGELAPVAGGPQNAILSSWQRSQLLNVSPDRCSPAYDPDLEVDTRLVRAADPVLDRLASRIAGTWTCVCLTDNQARIMAYRAGEASMVTDQHRPGFCVAEHVVGTTSVALALAERRSARLLGAEHFAELYQSIACVSAPVRDPLSGRIEGVLTIVRNLAEANPAVETAVCQARHAVERRMLEQVNERERALLTAYRQIEPQMRTPDRYANFRLGLDAVPSSVIGRDARRILYEKAAELIAAGRPRVVEVSLPHGQTALLLCTAVETHSAIGGLAVEVAFPTGGPPCRLMTSAMAVAEPSNSHPQRSEAAPRVRRFATDTSLLAIGQQGVGRLAVAARRRLNLLYEAGMHIGTTLEVSRTAEELARAAVPDLADVAAVDLLEPVLRGEEPAEADTTMHRVALHGIHNGLSIYPVGHQVNFVPSTPQARCLASGRTVLEADLHSAAGRQAQDPEGAERLLAEGIHSLMATPLRAGGVTLGVTSFYRRQQPAPYEDDDAVLAEELVTRTAPCLDNARRYAREQQLVKTQTALRSVATLVARGVPPSEVMAAVAEQVARLIGTDTARIYRFEADGTGTVAAAWGGPGLNLPVGTNLSLEGRIATGQVLRTGRSARVEDYEGAPGSLAAYVREHGVRSAVAAPIHVGGLLWGAATAVSTRCEPPPPDAEARLAEYTDLIGTAIANAQAHADLIASRARVVLAADEARRRIERDLHDGVQQRLISLGMAVRRAEADVPPEMAELRRQLSAVVAGLTGTVNDVRKISRGLHPAILTEGGLRPALKALARRSAVPVELDLHLQTRLPEPVEVAAYYVVTEALANAAKHARASLICVSAILSNDCLHLSVHDDGVGGADLDHGSGLIGLTDRVEALGGMMTVDSPTGQGTRLQATLPLCRA